MEMNRKVEMNEGEIRLKGGDRPGVKFDWKVEIILEGEIIGKPK